MSFLKKVILLKRCNYIYIFLWNELCNSRMQIAKEKKTKAIKTRIESVDYLQLQSKYVHFKDNVHFTSKICSASQYYITFNFWNEVMSWGLREVFTSTSSSLDLYPSQRCDLNFRPPRSNYMYDGAIWI